MTDSLVLVSSYSKVIDAEIAKSLLDAAGIYCVVVNDSLVAMDSLMGIGYGGVQLKVRPEDLEKAKKTLAEGLIVSE